MQVEEKGTAKPKIRLKKRISAAKAGVSGGATSSGVSPASSAPISQCGNNPLDRMCLKLLDWDVSGTSSSFSSSSSSMVEDCPPCSLTFDSYRSYVNTWEPLLVEEMRASILSCCPISTFEENTEKCSMQLPSDLESGYTPLVTAQLTVPGNMKCSPSYLDIVYMCEVPPPCENAMNTRPRQPNVLSNGFVNISKTVPPRPPPPPPPCLNPVPRKGFFAIVTAPPRRNEVILTFLRRRVLESRLDKNPKKFSIGQYDCKVLTCVNSSWREFLALHEAHRMPLLPYILQPCHSAIVSSTRTIPAASTAPCAVMSEDLRNQNVVTSGREVIGAHTPADIKEDGKCFVLEGVGVAFQEYVQSTFNSSQRLAMQCAVQKKEGFSLIQGPPGTGKTTTILGILNALHVRDYNRYFESLMQVSLGEEGLRCRRTTSGIGQTHTAITNLKNWSNLVNGISSKGIKPHLLVVAPSNVAVNNIIEKIMEKGFKDSSGSSYFPLILRIGSHRGNDKTKGSDNYQKVSVNSVSLDESVDALLHDEIDESITRLKKHLQDSIKEIAQLQTVLLNFKYYYGLHQLNPGWELRIVPESGQPYWVDHKSKSTSSQPPPFDPHLGLAFPSVDAAPGFKKFALVFVQLLEQLRITSLRHARVQAIVQHRGEFGTRNMSELRQTLESSFIEEADIVFSTLNSAGHPCLEGSHFPVVICDEAGQCVEMSTLIPLRHGAVQCVMVGDHKQLSATTFSKSAAVKGFDISLFERLETATEENTPEGQGADGAVMLNVQYRMLPEICRFPSQVFYKNKLIDGDNVKTPFYAPSFILNSIKEDRNRSLYLKPFLFLDLSESKERLVERSKSYSNEKEALLCVNLVQQVLREADRMNCNINSIGIITPYQEQLRELTTCFRTFNSGLERSKSINDTNSLEEGECAENIDKEDKLNDYEVDFSKHDIEINTVDAFQGREKDIVIFSCVRANDEGTIGFLSDRRRMNVALTRARYGMYVIGNSNTLRRSSLWDNLIHHAAASNSLVKIISATDDIRRCAVEGFQGNDLLLMENAQKLRHSSKRPPPTDIEKSDLALNKRIAL